MMHLATIALLALTSLCSVVYAQQGLLPPEQCPLSDICPCGREQVGPTQFIWAVSCTNMTFQNGGRIPPFYPEQSQQQSPKMAYLVNSGISTIQNSAFQSLQGLHTLQIAYNPVQIIQDNAFTGVEDTLTQLMITFGKLTSVPAQQIKNLTNLVLLDLSFNEITQIPSYAFQSLRNIRQVFMAFNKIVQIDSFAFTGMGPVEASPMDHIVLSSNKIQAIANNAFQGIRMQNFRLSLDNNSLTQIPTAIFKDIPGVLALNLSYNLIQALPPGSFLNLGMLQQLLLEGNDIRFIAPNVFEGSALAQTLELLSLFNNDLQFLPLGLFVGFKIKYLYLQDNLLTALPPGVFDGLERTLLILSLTGNELKSLDRAALGNLQVLQALFLAQNPWQCDCSLSWMRQVQVIQDNPLPQCVSPPETSQYNIKTFPAPFCDQCPMSDVCECQKVSAGFVEWGVNCVNVTSQTANVPPFKFLDNSTKVVVLYNNGIQAIQDGAFRNLAGTLSLTVQENPLTNIANNAFVGLEPSLTTLAIMFTDITSMPIAAMSRLVNLINIKLNNNRITQIPPRAFAVFQKLQTLDLSFNYIQVLDPYVFSGFGTPDQFVWHTLQLFSNQIRSIHSEAFANMRVVSAVNLMLMNNSLTTIPSQSFRNLPALKLLSLNVNKISQLPSRAFSTLKSVEKLYLGVNEISQIADDAFEGPHETITELGLDGNRLQQVPVKAISKMSALQVLQLGNNSLSSFSFNYPMNFASLYWLVAAGNNIQQIPADAFTGLSNINVFLTLDLGRNNIQFVHPRAFEGIRDVLSELNMQQNNLQSNFFQALQQTPSLEFLDVQDNDITEIPAGSFKTTPRLAWLNVSYNAIQRLSKETFEGIENSLTTLSVEGNQIPTINFCTVRRLVRLSTLQYHDNPFTCDCNIAWLRDAPYLPIPKPDVQCAGPINYQQYGIGTFPRDQCRPNTQCDLSDIPQPPTGNQTTPECPINQNVCQCAPMPISPTQLMWEIGCINKTTGSRVPNFNYVDNQPKNIRLENNQIREIQDNAFQNLTAVTGISIINNPVSMVRSGALNGIANGLVSLAILGGNLTSIPFNALRNATVLQVLALSGNQISSIPPRSFEMFPALINLELAGNNIKTLDAYTFVGFGAPAPLLGLNLGSNEINYIHKNAFSGMKRGQQTAMALSLDNNQLTNLPSEALQETPPLAVLSLADNKINQIPSRAFERVPPIIQLLIGNNSIGQLPQDAFTGIHPTLQVLGLDRNQLREVPQQAIKNLPSLAALFLSGNPITDIRFSTPLNSTMLASLSLVDLQVDNIPANAFRGLANTQIQSLELRGSNIRTIDRYAFQDIKQMITNLDLVNNKINEDALQSLEDMKQLTFLRLAGNDIKSIPEGSFRTLDSLTWLNLQNNSLTSLPPQSLQGARDTLRSVLLDGNKFTTLDECTFRGMRRFEVLTFSNNSFNCDCKLAWVRRARVNIGEIPEQCSQPTSSQRYTVIDFPADSCEVTAPSCDGSVATPSPPVKPDNSCPFNSDCQCRKLQIGVRPYWFIQCNITQSRIPEFKFVDNDNVKFVYLRGPLLTTIQNNAFINLPKMTALSILDSSVSVIENQAFKGVEDSLKDVLISDAKLTSIPLIALQNMTELNSIRLKNNSIMSIPQNAFQNFKKLTAVDLSYNKIRSLGAYTFNGFGKQQREQVNPSFEIKLGHNMIDSINGNAFTGTSQVSNTSIDFGHNELTSIPSQIFKDLPGIKTISFVSNKIPRIPSRAFQTVQYLEELYLGENPITSIPNDAFQGPHDTIKILALNGAKFSQIPSRSLSPLSSLAILYLGNNSVLSTVNFDAPLSTTFLYWLDLTNLSNPNIPANAFDGLSNVKVNLRVTFEGSKIRNIDQNAFNGIKDSLKALDLKDNQLSESSLKSFENLPKLRQLHLANNEFTNLPPRAFSNLQLLYLDLGYNRLTYLHPETLDGLENYLEDLILTGNQLKTLEYCALEGFEVLASLLFHENPIECNCSVAWIRKSLFNLQDTPCIEPREMTDYSVMDFPASNCERPSKCQVSTTTTARPTKSPIPPGQCRMAPYCTCAEYAGTKGWSIYCNDTNQGPEIPPFTRANNGDPKSVSVTGTQIQRVQDYAFSNLQVVNKLVLKNNKINSLSQNSFAGIESTLAEIDLSKNKFTSFPASAFRYLDKLSSIDLSNNQINTIAANVLSNMKSLKKLILSGNNIQAIGSFVFSGFGNPSQKVGEMMIALDNNGLRSINENAFRGFQNSNSNGDRKLSLLLQDNELTTVPVLKDMPTLEKLDLSNNKIQSIPASSLMVRVIDNLTLSHNNLASLDDNAFAATPSVGILLLDNNRLTSTPSTALSKLTGTEEINMANNEINNINFKPKLDAMSLRSLDMSGNPLSQIPAKAFEGFYNIENGVRKIMNFNDTSLTKIDPDAFSDIADYIETLAIGKNKLDKDVFNALSTLTKLRKLHLGDNEIDEIPETSFKNMDQLAMLDVTNNHLKYLKSKVFEPLSSSLKTLNIDGNEISELDSCMFEKLGSLGKLTVNDNPWDCTCDLEWIQSERFVKGDQAMCSTPQDKRGERLMSFSADNCKQKDCSSSSSGATTSPPPNGGTTTGDKPNTKEKKSSANYLSQPILALITMVFLSVGILY